ncbi:hypothetical protein [Methanocella sp. MCL-LM]|uniref:hypothetical protein n=1 Tax=Methanocella sp. MCL-LM TaxID=3412035 RepID=UPI003C78A3F0
MEVGEFPGGRGGFSSWEVREGQRLERRSERIERFERIILKVYHRVFLLLEDPFF